jgi:hypothetical protein
VGILTTTLKILKFPLKLLTGLLRKKRQKTKKSELEKKQLTHVRNFDPTRLTNRSWQKSIGKKSKKHYKKRQK